MGPVESTRGASHGIEPGLHRREPRLGARRSEKRRISESEVRAAVPPHADCIPLQRTYRAGSPAITRAAKAQRRRASGTSTCRSREPMTDSGGSRVKCPVFRGLPSRAGRTRGSSSSTWTQPVSGSASCFRRRTSSIRRRTTSPTGSRRCVPRTTGTAGQVAAFSDRLVAFCSFNPLAEYALAELERCASSGRFVGIKLHFGMSAVNLKDAAHVAKVREVVEAANRRGMSLIVHVRAGPEYGGEEARVLLDRIVSAAPDVTFQIAHLLGRLNNSLRTRWRCTQTPSRAARAGGAQPAFPDLPAEVWHSSSVATSGTCKRLSRACAKSAWTGSSTGPTGQWMTRNPPPTGGKKPGSFH